MCPWASRPRVIRPRDLVLCFLCLKIETKFWVFQTGKQADEAVMGALKQKKRLVCLGLRKGFRGVGWGLEWRPSPVRLGSDTEIDSPVSEQGGRRGRERVRFQAGRKWAGDRDPCLR